MAISENTVRKVLTFSAEIADQVSAYGESIGARSEAEAYRRLVEIGLESQTSSASIKMQCEAAYAKGDTLRAIATKILTPNPRVVAVHFYFDKLHPYGEAEEQHLFVVLTEAEAIRFSGSSWTVEKIIEDNPINLPRTDNIPF